MAVITLNTSQFGIEDATIQWRTQRYFNRSAAFITTATSNGAAQPFMDMTINAVNKDEKDYIEGTILAAAYSFDEIKFTLPSEVYTYGGTASANAISIHSTSPKTAGGNTIILADGNSGFPAATVIQAGMLFTIGTDNRLYRVNSYTASTGTAVIFPFLRKTLTTGDAINYTSVSFVGNITNDPASTYYRNNNGFVSYDLTIEESAG